MAIEQDRDPEPRVQRRQGRRERVVIRAVNRVDPPPDIGSEPVELGLEVDELHGFVRQALGC